ncbi:heparinase II/III family protein [Occultella kanbiaonis]|uniref:heparinase II/III domain-containing protein n=1 Tax=Occultella kanbiaonis TaxID=2675754 RepID=UPI0013D3F66A|nr:heparinase II/III family protein [Occultella kanbiaonis]
MTRTDAPAAPVLRSTFGPDRIAEALSRGGARVPFPRAEDRAAWAAITPANSAILTRVSSAVADRPWPAPTYSQRLAFTRSGSRRAFEEPYFDRRRRLTALALALAAEPDRHDVDDLIDGLGFVLEEASWCLPAHDTQPGQQRRDLPDPQDPVLDLFAGETAATLSWIAWLHADRLAAAGGLLERIRAEISRRVLVPFETFGPAYTWYAVGTNWNPWIVANVLTATVLHPPSPERTRAIVASALTSLDGYLAHAPQDGGCTEGIMYWWQSAARLYEAVDVLGWADPDGAAQVLAHPLLRSMVRYPLVVHLGGQWSASFGDGVSRVPQPGPGIDKDRHPPALLHRFALAVADDDVAAMARTLTPELELPVAMYRSLVTLFDPNWPDGGASGPEQPSPPAVVGSYWLGESEVISLGSADGRLRLVAKGGHNDEPHNHNDVGSFVLAVDGQPLLIDVGTGQYTAASFSPSRYDTWYLRSEFHSVPQVDGVGQSPGAQFRGEVLARDSSSIRLELAGAYPAQAGLTSWQRELRLADDGLRITEQWALAGRGDGAGDDAEDPDVRVHLLLARPPVRAADGSLGLRGPDGDAVLAHLHVDAGDFELSVETIGLEDAILRGVWGPEIAKVVLRATGDGRTGRGQVTISLP